MTGIKGGKDTGTESEKAGNGTATTAPNIGKGAMAGDGTVDVFTARKAPSITTAQPATIGATNSSSNRKEGRANSHQADLRRGFLLRLVSNRAIAKIRLLAQRPIPC